MTAITRQIIIFFLIQPARLIISTDLLPFSKTHRLNVHVMSDSRWSGYTSELTGIGWVIWGRTQNQNRTILNHHTESQAASAQGAADRQLHHVISAVRSTVSLYIWTSVSAAAAEHQSTSIRLSQSGHKYWYKSLHSSTVTVCRASSFYRNIQYFM